MTKKYGAYFKIDNNGITAEKPQKQSVSASATPAEIQTDYNSYRAYLARHNRLSREIDRREKDKNN